MVLQRQRQDGTYHAHVVDESAHGKGLMRRNLTPRIIIVCAALVLAAASAASAQIDEDAPPLEEIEGVKTAVVLNANTDGTVNATIDQAALAAHEAIGGVDSDNRKKDGFFPYTMPDSRSVVEQALRSAGDRSDPTNLVIMSGGDSQLAIGQVARTSLGNTTFIDLGQAAPCLDAEGRADQTGECLGGVDLLPFNYSAVTFEVEDPAYLAGVIAASASRHDRLGIISGMPDCEECNRYVQGFIRGAQSIEPEIDIEVAYLADAGEEGYAFGDPNAARTFADAFIDIYQPDVLLPIASGASLAMIEAADDAGILAIGTDVDVASLHPELVDTVLASITRDVGTAVRDSIYEYTTGNLPRVRAMTLSDGSVDLTGEWQRRSGLTGDVAGRYQDARDALLSGTVQACPSNCGEPYGPNGSVIVAEPEPEIVAEPSVAPADG
jgi:basic membrane lipoprotein Med (substrate-binding protein (PBP1-ABC) superfamily)